MLQFRGHFRVNYFKNPSYLNMNNFDTSIKRASKLPSLKINAFRSTSAKLQNNHTNQTLPTDELTPYFKHSRHQSNCQDFSILGPDISLICQRIMQEQKFLKEKISQQEAFLKKICRRKPPIPQSLESNNKENKEITFKPLMWPQSAKDNKRFRFPREVFTRKVKTRQS